MSRKQLTASIVALIGALVLASTQWQAARRRTTLLFTNAVPQVAAHALSGNAISGEPKNQLPFTRVAQRDAIAPDWFERSRLPIPTVPGSELRVSSLPRRCRRRDVSLE